MERVEVNGEWSLFCPNECPDLHDTYGDEFHALYAKYESEGVRKTIKARELWDAITQSQIETEPIHALQGCMQRKSIRRTWVQ